MSATKSITLYSSLSGKKEAVRKPGGKPLRLFVCGPTVYDHSHIGHGRTYIFFDFFAKYLCKLGWGVKYVQNITDVDDKVIKRAAEERRDPLELAKQFAVEHVKDMKSLGVTAVDFYAPASQFIPQIMKQVERLIKKGYAYRIDGDGWYFDISKFPDYGKLARRTVAQAEDGVSRIDESAGKRNKGDFCLWKFPRGADEKSLEESSGGKTSTVFGGEPLWKTALGWGRPGWHIEDTAISEHFFGPQYDIHGGGLDLKFPHHEAEIAQQEAASGKKPFVKIWMHSGLLTVGGEKMSKSLGNFVTIRSALLRHSPALLRYFFLSHHYRSPANYDERALEGAKRALAGTAALLGKIDFLARARWKGASGPAFDEKTYEKEFWAALADDVNTPAAFSALFRAGNDAQKVLWNLDARRLRAVQEFIAHGFGLFGITFPRSAIPENIAAVAAERENFRRYQQFTQSDRLRKKIDKLGYLLEDTPAGPFVWPK